MARRMEELSTTYNYSVGLSDEVEERSLHLDHSINPRGFATRVTNARDEEEDRGQDVTPGG